MVNLSKSLYGVIVFSILSLSTNLKASCWEEAASMYGHDPLLLKAIAWKESRGYTKAVGTLLKDGNRALGLMQINTIHLPFLSKYGIRREHLFDPCLSQKIGAWVLAECLQKKGDIWKAVGCYYGGPASRAYNAMDNYAKDVKHYYEGYQRQYQQYNIYPSVIVNGKLYPPSLNSKSNENYHLKVNSESNSNFRIIRLGD